MYLKTLVGLYAGQILNFSPEASAAMLADGRAVRVDDNYHVDEPFCDPSPAYPPVQPHGTAASPVTGKPAGGDAREAPHSGSKNGKRGILR